MLRAAAIFSFLFAACALGAEQIPPRSTVYVAQDDDAISGYTENAARVREMTETLIAAACGTATADEAWRSLVQPADRVGIKVSASGGPLFSTHQALVRTIAEGLAGAGVATQNIVVWDRAEMTAFASSRYQTHEITPRDGYDVKQSFTVPMLGKLIWGDALFKRRLPGEEQDQVSDESHFARLLGGLTKIINVPVLTTVESCGVGGCFYNLTVPDVDNWRRFAQAPDPAFCELYADPRLGKKVVLNIMDGLIAQFAGGPDFQPNYAWNYATILASKDPVALDATALREIDAWRAQANLPALGNRASYLQTAEQMGLGHAAAESIEIKKIWPK